MKKQMILLVATIVFALILCGPITAVDPQENVDTDSFQMYDSNTNQIGGQQDLDPQIHGTVKEIYNESSGTYTNLTNAIPVKGAKITVQNPANGLTIATGTTDADGKYDINFVSTLTQFKVEITYSTYKKFITNVTPTGSPIPDAVLNHTFMPDIAILSSVAEKGVGIRNLNNRRLIYLDMWNPSSSPTNDWIMEYVNFAYLDMAMPGTGWGDSWYDELLKSPANANYKISSAFGFPSCDIDTDPYGGDGLHLLGGHDINDTADTVENTYIGSYYALATGTALQTNLQNMVDYIYFLLGETTIDPTKNGKSPIMATPDWGIYHPDYPTKIVSSVPTQTQIKTWIEGNMGYIAPYYSLKWIDQNYNTWAANARNNVYQQFENWYTTTKANTTGPFIVIASYGPGGEFAPTIDALIREYERQGRAVLNLFQGATNPPISSLLEELVKGKDGNGPLARGVSAITSLYSWSLNYENLSGDGALSELERINLEVIKGLQLSDQGSLTNPLGAQYEWTFAVTFPYFEGVFSPIVISYTDENGFEHPIDAGIKKLISLTNQWAKLKELPNSNKKIAIILYNYPPGKAEIGASYLNIFQSVHDLLLKLKEQGYDVGTKEIPTAEELYTLVAEFGNKGSWAQNLLNQYVEKNMQSLQINKQLVNASTYSQWFNQLPDALKQQVISKWGQLVGDIMDYNGSLVIPGLMFGNVFLTVQPSRGWEEVENYHDPYLPPHHQYIAFYKWLEKSFGANAIIHMGTHGTLEWLPGRNVGLQEDDWPFRLANIPNINPYIVSNPGEGMVAKDRAGALIIDHMTPAMVRSGLYGNLIVIHDLIHQYENALNVGNYQIIPALESQITAKAIELKLQNQQQGQNFSEWLNHIHLQLHEIENDIIPLGLHSLGKVLTGDELIEEVFTISSSMTQILNHMKMVLYPAITVGYFDMQKNTQYGNEIDTIDALIKNYIQRIANGEDPTSLGVTNSNLLDDLKYCKEIIVKIRDNQEWNNLLNALNGGFVSSGLGADPSYADVLPTGMNFYASNPKKMPTKAAWETGKKVADQLLTDHYKKHGKFPETIGMIMWGTELLRTDAISIAEFMYLLGAMPVWNSNGDLQPNPVLIPLENLTITIDGITIQRPRIDVFTTAVTGNEIWINIMNNAVKLVSEAPGETASQNYVIKHLAENASLDRIFGLPGMVLEGTGVSDLVPNTGKWKTNDELASVYLSRVSYAWRSTSDGVSIEQNKNTFQYLLGSADMITQSIDSTWRLLDTDDYYDWYGGMLLASRGLGGNPDDVLVDLRNKNKVVTRTTQEEMGLEIRSQLLNTKYMDSLLNTPSGWMEYADKYKNLFAMDVTTNSVSDDMWTQVAQNLLDPRFTATEDYQAFATQSMLGWVIESARRDIWKADSGTLTALEDKYVAMVNEYGVSCCHHTCANVEFNKFLVTGSSLSLDQLQQFADAFEGATGKTIGIIGTPAEDGGQNTNPNQGSTSTSGNPEPASPGETSTVQAASEVGKTSDSNSQNAHEISEMNNQSSSQSNTPLIAIIGVILLICLVGVGYFKSSIMDFLKK
ncbi:MAG TPA: cobaltochelatase subunit CobN [Methanobacterium sp.]|nr:cobaltochelatase subunit CobN [Methanobacterium sp.]